MTKAKVVAMAKQTGCTLEIESDAATLIAPKGKTIGDFMHYSVFEYSDYSKKHIWESFYYDMQTIETCEGTDYCTCGQNE